MTTPKTWEEAAELAAATLYEPPPLNIYGYSDLHMQAWIAAAQRKALLQADRVLRALRAAGLAVVPRGETTAIGYVMSGINGQPTWSAALSAGELAPPDKGEG